MGPHIDGVTRVAGIIGDPVAHSLSPRMQNAAFLAAGLPWCYVPFRVPAAGLEAAVRGLVALGIAGINVTIPHKEAIIPLLDGIDDAAGRIGAVNTVVIKNGRLHGYNTDAHGLLEALRRDGGCDPEGRRVAVLGAGGGARAALVAVGEAGAASVDVLNRTVERGRRLVGEMAEAFPRCRMQAHPLEPAVVREVLLRCEMLIQTTSVGMGQEASPVEVKDALHPELFVFDMIYHPRETRLLRLARGAGARTLGGLAMLVYQGAWAFELWTGHPAPVDAMKTAVDLEG
ncbi:MAG: shikimate dehydrogenase [Armatimonadetes bacterium]|nr:shikimate dehydrogenase [Armatimonadota bacterium]